MTRPYHILSFDGGGVRGAYTAMLLHLLQEEVPFLDKVDLFVGTSSGSILALSLAYGLNPSQIVFLFENFGKASFVPFKEMPKYQNSALKDLLKAHVFTNDPLLSDLKRKVVVPAFNLHDKAKKRWGMHLFHNFKEENAHLIDALLSSSAAPIYFPAYQNYIDGGVFAPNPSMLGLSSALENDPHCKLENVSLLSIGSGDMLHVVDKEVSHWDSPSSHPPHTLFTLVTEGTNDVSDYMCKNLLKENYFRLNTPFKTPIPLDAPDKIHELFAIAKSVPKEFPDLWKDLRTWVEKKFLK